MTDVSRRHRDSRRRHSSVGELSVLLDLTIAGYLGGRALFHRLDPQRFRLIGLALVVVTGLASIVAGLSA